MEGTDDPTNRTSCPGNMFHRMNPNGPTMDPIPGPVSRTSMRQRCESFGALSPHVTVTPPLRE